MKKRKIALCLLAAAAALLGGCKSGSPETPEVSLVKAGTLTAAFIDGNDGFASYTDGQPSGTEIYLAGELAKALELTIEYKEAGSQEELLSMLDSGQADVALGRFSEGFAGSDSYLLSRNYGKRGYYLVSPAGNYADTLAGLEGEVVSVFDGIPAETVISIPMLSVTVQTTFSDLAAAAAEVKKGAVSALICTERQAFELLSDEELLVKELYGSPRELYCAVFPAGAAEWAAQFNAVVETYLDEVAAGTLTAEGVPIDTNKE